MVKVCVRSTRALCAGLVALSLASTGVDASTSELLVGRAEDPVIVTGNALAGFQGRTNTSLAAFRWDDAAARFIPIPYQIDERVNHVFNSGTEYQFSELMYDVMREDNGRLDADDELVFLFGDGGPQAPTGAAWPAGADIQRYEIVASDPRPGSTEAPRFVYLFSGNGLEHATPNYVSWDLSRSTSITTGAYALDFADKWLLNGIRILQPCGTGEDILDRAKGRAGTPQTDRGETEELWNPISIYMGGMAGPIRAIRYVRGAASGLNTIHHDVVYQGFWERQLNLRVHDISNAFFYLDLRPNLGTTFYSPSTPLGVPVDGEPDPSVSTTLPAWTTIRGPKGGFGLVYDVPPSPFVIATNLYYRDDLTYNDQPPTVPVYGDEDNSAYGNQGLSLSGLIGTETDTIPLRLRFYPLCADEGDAAMGEALREIYDVPVQITTELQTGTTSAVRSLQVTRDFADVVLTWQAVAGATGYRIFVSDEPDLPKDDWTHVGDVTGTTYRDVAGALDPQHSFYSVVPLTASGEGGW